MRLYFNYILLIFLLCACGSKETLSLQKSRDIVLRFETAIGNLSNISYFREGTTGYISYVNTKTHSLNFRNIQSDSIDFRVDLHSFDSIQDTEDGIACLVHTRDSIFILLNERNTVYLADSAGKIKAHWDVNVSLENNNSKYVLQDSPSMRLFYQDHRIYIQVVRDDIAVNTPANRQVYFNTPAELILDISKEPFSITNTTGQWPMIYRTGKGYQDFWPARCVNNRNEPVYSFSVNDSLFTYKDERLISVTNAASTFPRHVSAYPDDSAMHFAYLKKYNASESRYKFIFFNPYLDTYYRVFSRGVQEQDKDERIHQLWSFIVLDPQLNTLCETGFHTGEFNYFSILPVPEGVMICKTNGPEDGRNILRFGLFNLRTDEI